MKSTCAPQIDPPSFYYNKDLYGILLSTRNIKESEENKIEIRSREHKVRQKQNIEQQFK